ncbi:hypothetical protein [Rubrobacter radiotolerans]|uniref:Uncharacterized protein n=1 Tax=Rubrobacter radiotolerans TaxID=42256 RepID=A0AB35SYZ7_RUBRA|nr:hypothetical protein [Rubrobacter radiotolerans]MDX5892705.1 hypothetical protein [Rubrobacter radiotolerans]SMC02322.1 conserved hypothetical protein [Rubrobacter radiotolerans DSM 5868]
MGINQRVSLRKFIDDIRRWVNDGKSDEWIASALGTSSSSVQSFRSRNGIYRRTAGPFLPEIGEHSSYEGVLEEGPGLWFDPSVNEDERWKKNWSDVNDVDIHITASRIYIVRHERDRD